MITLASGSIFWIIFFVILIIKKIDFSYYSLVFTSVLTTVAFIFLGEDNIYAFQIVFLITLTKFIWEIFNNRSMSSVSPAFWLFIVYCGLTIPCSLLHKNTFVMNINNVYSYVRFNYQQITQYAYLIIGFATTVMGNALLHSKKINIDAINRTLMYSYIFTLVFALLQHILPLEFVNTYFRNGVHVIYNFEGTRISGTFGEPSFLSLYCAPLFAGYAYKFLCSFKIKYAILSFLFIIVTLDNQSSSGVLGIIFTFILLFIVRSGKKTLRKKHIILMIIFIMFFAVLVILNFDLIYEVYDILISKLNGEGRSGSGRTESLLYHIRVGLTNFIPIGYGTVRSYDLLSTWLCEIGILGVMIYFVIIISLCYKLFKINSQDSIQLMFCIIIHNIIMFVSVCEVMFLSLWIYYGMAYYLIYKPNNKKRIKNI